MRTKLILSALLLLPILIVSGCQSIEEQEREEIAEEALKLGVILPTDVIPPPAVKQSFTGIRGGAVAGNLMGRLASGAVGEYLFSIVKSGRQTAGAYDYHVEQGPLIIIEKVFVWPRMIGVGKILDLNIRYVILNPTRDTWTPVTETREIIYKGELLGRPQVHTSFVDGTYTTTVPLYLPLDVEIGEYRLIATVQTAYARDSEEVTFMIVGRHQL